MMLRRVWDAFFRVFKTNKRFLEAAGIIVFCAAFFFVAQGSVLAQTDADASNPLGSTWKIENELTWTQLKGGVFDKAEPQFVYNLQPVMAFPMGKSFNLLARVTVPFGSSPFVSGLDFNLFPPGIVDPADPLGSIGANIKYADGVGNTSWVTLVKPNKGKGFNWGFEPTFIIPTASRTELGSSLWQGGPAIIGMYMGDNVMGGVLY